MIVNYLKCTIDNMPMETFIPGKKPTIQNTSNWIQKNKRDEEYYQFIHEMADAVRGIKK